MLTGGFNEFSTDCIKFDGGKSKGEFFSRVKKTMVPSIYVRPSLNLGRVSLIYYNIVGILHEQYHTKDTSGQCVCPIPYVPSQTLGLGSVCVSHLAVSHL